jgi:hypothetical protein
MKEKNQILEAAKRMEPDPPRSKLDDYAEIIWELRSKRKRICTITAFLNQQGIQVGKSTVARWLKTHPLPKASAAKHTNASAPSTPAVRQLAAEFFQPVTDKSKDHEQKQRPYFTDR